MATMLCDVIGVRRRFCSNGKMQEGKKREKEKKRSQCDRELDDGQMKRRKTASSMEECSKPLEPPEGPQEPSQLEDGGLDLSRSFKPISGYMQERREMLEQCFSVLGENKLQEMLPNELKDCSLNEIKKLCWDQLLQISDIHLLEILDGKELSVTAAPEQKSCTDSQQDSNVDSTSSLRDNPDSEEKQGSGEDSDVLSINAEIDDSDIEGHKVPKSEEPPPKDEAPPPRDEAPPPAAIPPPEPKVELQQDIERSVSEILNCSESRKEPSAERAGAPETAEKHPSAQQLELLELEMRARAIKALMKAGESKKLH